jgi:hypothetical protein
MVFFKSAARKCETSVRATAAACVGLRQLVALRAGLFFGATLDGCGLPNDAVFWLGINTEKGKAGSERLNVWIASRTLCVSVMVGMSKEQGHDARWNGWQIWVGREAAAVVYASG